MDNIVLKMEAATKKFDELIALNDINFEIQKGSITGLIGKNGSGKNNNDKIIARVIST